MTKEVIKYYSQFSKERRISESPPSVMAMQETPKYLPQPVPRSLQEPWQWWTVVLESIAQYSISDFLRGEQLLATRTSLATDHFEQVCLTLSRAESLKDGLVTNLVLTASDDKLELVVNVIVGLLLQQGDQRKIHNKQKIQTKAIRNNLQHSCQQQT